MAGILVLSTTSAAVVGARPCIAADVDPLGAGIRPRVLLTSERLAELGASRATTHRAAWSMVQAEADSYVERPLPSNRTQALNAYRGHGSVLPALALAFRLTGERKYLDAAKRWMLGMVRFDTWDGSGNLGRAAFSCGIATTYDWLFDQLSETERGEIRQRLRSEGLILRDVVEKRTRVLSNHCHNELAGLGLIGYALWGEVPEAESFVSVAEEKARQVLEFAPRDGAWPEGVSYWGYGTAYLLRFLEAQRLLGRGDAFATSAWLRKTGDYFVYMSVPEASWAHGDVVFDLGDCAFDGGSYAGTVLRRLASAYHSGVYQRFADLLMEREQPRSAAGKPRESTDAWMHFLWFDPTIAPAEPRDWPTFKHFDDLDIVTMRSGWERDATALAFHCGPGPGHQDQAHPARQSMDGFGPGHGHPDNNAVALISKGQWLIVDPGYARVKDTRAENTVVVNGAGQAGEGHDWLDYRAYQERLPTPAIPRAESTPTYDSVLGDAGNIYVDEAKLRHFRRQILFLKPDVLVIADDLEARVPSQFEWLFQSMPSSWTAAAKGAFIVKRPGVRLWVRPLRPVGVVPRILNVQTHASIDPTSALTLAVADKPRVQSLLVMTVLRDSDPVPTVSLRAGRLWITHHGRTHGVRLMRARGPSEPLLVPIERRMGRADYHFVRDTGGHASQQ